MPDLAALERAFAAALTARSVEAADVTPFAGPAVRTRARLRLYRGNVQVNARHALANAHPVCARLVGADFFDGLAYEYAARTPSRSGDLNEYGAGFAGFLAAFPPVSEQVPYLPDVAKLEWLVHLAHYAADAPPFDAAVLAGIPAAQLGQARLVPAPATALVESRWPVASIWRAHVADDDHVPEVDLASGP
ncbi:MAG TPA: DNA-binding domain-containing protein, partial [Casimicrobiaceae bacterium]